MIMQDLTRISAVRYEDSKHDEQTVYLPRIAYP